jgi:preprotein translocase subunit SecD
MIAAVFLFIYRVRGRLGGFAVTLSLLVIITTVFCAVMVTRLLVSGSVADRAKPKALPL